MASAVIAAIHADRQSRPSSPGNQGMLPRHRNTTILAYEMRCRYAAASRNSATACAVQKLGVPTTPPSVETCRCLPRRKVALLGPRLSLPSTSSATAVRVLLPVRQARSDRSRWRPQHSADWPRRRHTRTPAGLGGSPSLIQGGNGDTGGKRSLLWVRSTETMSGCALNAAAAPVRAAAKPVTARQLTTPITTMLLAVRVNRCGQRAAQNH
jgi:hypothetical protein